jgi:hypothetical protein
MLHVMSAREDAARLQARTYAFLRNHIIDQPFYTEGFATAVDLPLEEAEALLGALARRNEVHRTQDGWQPGPPPPPPTYDQM